MLSHKIYLLNLVWMYINRNGSCTKLRMKVAKHLLQGSMVSHPSLYTMSYIVQVSYFVIGFQVANLLHMHICSTARCVADIYTCYIQK